MKRYLLLNDNTIVDTESNKHYDRCENGSFMVIEGNLYFGKIDKHGKYMGLHVDDVSDNILDFTKNDDLVIVKFDDGPFKSLQRPKFAYAVEDYETIITILKKTKYNTYISYDVPQVSRIKLNISL